jgi:hypothetical protein
MSLVTCPCRMCNNIIHSYLNFWSFHPQESPEEQEVVNSVYGRLERLAEQLKAYGAPQRFVNEVNGLCDEIDNIDNHVNALKKEVAQKDGVTLTAVKLGEISKELF